MKVSIRSGFAAVVLLVSSAPIVSGKVIAPWPVPERVARADAVVTGKVTSVENKAVKIDGAEYQIAVVQIEDAILGTKGLTHLRVAFHPNVRFPQLNLMVGQESLFFLRQVPAETYFITRMYFDVVPKSDTTAFKSDVEWAKKSAKALQDPKASLQAKDAETRLLAASMLVSRYRNPEGSTGKLEPVDADESKLILLALADADWSVNDFRAPLNPLQTWYKIGAGPADGFNPPPDFKQLGDAAKMWLKANAGTYRIKKFVK
jgi:hypothetical protein